MKGSLLLLLRVTAIKCLRDPDWSHQSQMVVCSSDCSFLFSYVLTQCFVDTILPLSSFVIPFTSFMSLSSFKRNSFSEKLAYNHLTMAMHLFWPMKCLLSLYIHSFQQFRLFCLSFSLSMLSPILIYRGFLFPIHERLLSFISVKALILTLIWL